MITLERSPETWDKAVGHMVLGHTRHNAVAETALRDALKVLGIEVSVAVPACGNCKHWTRHGRDSETTRGDCASPTRYASWTQSTFSCQFHTPEGSE